MPTDFGRGIGGPVYGSVDAARALAQMDIANTQRSADRNMQTVDRIGQSLGQAFQRIGDRRADRAKEERVYGRQLAMDEQNFEQQKEIVGQQTWQNYQNHVQQEHGKLLKDYDYDPKDFQEIEELNRINRDIALDPTYRGISKQVAIMENLKKIQARPPRIRRQTDQQWLAERGYTEPIPGMHILPDREHNSVKLVPEAIKTLDAETYKDAVQAQIEYRAKVPNATSAGFAKAFPKYAAALSQGSDGGTALSEIPDVPEKPAPYQITSKDQAFIEREYLAEITRLTNSGNTPSQAQRLKIRAGIESTYREAKDQSNQAMHESQLAVRRQFVERLRKDGLQIVDPKDPQHTLDVVPPSPEPFTTDVGSDGGVTPIPTQLPELGSRFVTPQPMSVVPPARLQPDQAQPIKTSESDWTVTEEGDYQKAVSDAMKLVTGSKEGKEKSLKEQRAEAVEYVDETWTEMGRRLPPRRSSKSTAEPAKPDNTAAIESARKELEIFNKMLSDMAPKPSATEEKVKALKAEAEAVGNKEVAKALDTYTRIGSKGYPAFGTKEAAEFDEAVKVLVKNNALPQVRKSNPQPVQPTFAEHDFFSNQP